MIGWGLVLGGICLLYAISFASARAGSPPGWETSAEQERAGLAMSQAPHTAPTAVAQITETPGAYPGPGEGATPAATAEPGDSTPTPESGYPAGANIDGTDRVGEDDPALFGNGSGSDEEVGTGEAAQVERRGLGGFILWLGFLFGLVVFVAGLFFSVFLSTRDRRTDF